MANNIQDKRNNSETVLLSEAKSVCPVCLKRIDAGYVVRKGSVYLDKTCDEHGSFSVPIWDNPIGFLQWKMRVVGEIPSEMGDCPNNCGICENHIQETCCVLLEVTQRCNLECPICFASSEIEDDSEDPSIERIAEWYDMLMEKGGPFNIQLSGGEPTMRDDLPEIIKIGKEKGFTFFQLNTNGLRIANEEGYIEKLKEAGLVTVFLQFDGFSDKANIALRGRNLVEEKIRAIEQCREAHVGVVLVPTIMTGANDDEIGELLQFASEQMPIVRGVHFQPISLFGRHLAEGNVRITLPKLFDLMENQTDKKVRRIHISPSNAEHPLCGFHVDYKVKNGEWEAMPSNQEACSCGVSSLTSRTITARKWSAPEKSYESEKTEMQDISSFDEFIAERQNTTLAISGMAFQDAYTMDLDRLRRCYVNIVSHDGRLIPFCSYNLSSDSGETLYR